MLNLGSKRMRKSLGPWSSWDERGPEEMVADSASFFQTGRGGIAAAPGGRGRAEHVSLNDGLSEK